MSVVCRFCNQSNIKKGEFCLNCGYDPKTDTLSPLFKARRAGQDDSRKLKSVSFVKIFAIVGIVLTIFSVFYKHNFDVSSIIVKGKELFREVSYGEFVHIGSKGKSLITNRTQAEPDKILKKRSVGKLILGGIFFVPHNQSYVIINNQVLKENEFFEGILVKKIYGEKVEVEINGEKNVLKANERIYFIK